MFKKEGNDALKSIKEARKILKEADRETKKKENEFFTPPPYLPLEEQLPILKKVEVSGIMQLEGQVE